ncbi:WG repeat-containing protein [Campylobacter lari]|uniref:WG repeat-containing protein n=1 Tax=Campylobacter lari TaxID=201 RepID=UPI001BD4AF2C|nr:WG repeat-containing protein [Campylobacter lari]MBT0831658.1 WG repeat-containing protein [Campylobacter lari]MCR6775992.1 WG repeat-containing protein [Campylobacter lari]MCV3386433.1 WG repeat-containing protein [Campylobacter lari]MCV3501058.1 WG repeat-containing protein [Campylobacter lari]
MDLINNTKWGFIDKNGDFIIKPQFDYIGNFKKGLAIVGYGINLFDCNAEKYGFIKENGKILIDIQFDEVGDFEEGYAKVAIKINKQS